MSTAASCLIVTPTLGRSPWFPATVASVAAIPGLVRHVVVCPPDAESAVAAAAPRATVVAQTGAGLYRALNDGLKSARDGWDTFSWINDDDLLCADGVTTAVAKLAADPSVGIVYGRVGLIGSDGREMGALPVARRAADLPALLARGVVPFAQPGTFIRRSVVEKLAGFDESYRLAGDLDFFVRALSAGGRFAFVDCEVARFRLNAAQLSKDEATGAEEKARALCGLGAGSGGLGALVRFRWANCGVYLDRVRRHGLVSMRSIYRKA